MGCASSNPLAESGKTFVKNAKDSAAEIAHKGEHVVQDMGETAKDGITTGVGHIKDAVGSTIETVGNDFKSTMNNVTGSFANKKKEIEKAAEEIENSAEEKITKGKDHAAEAFSQAETVLATEAENVADKMEKTAESVKNEVKEGVSTGATALGESVSDMLEIEDIEKTLDEIGNDIDTDLKDGPTEILAVEVKMRE